MESESRSTCSAIDSCPSSIWLKTPALPVTAYPRQVEQHWTWSPKSHLPFCCSRWCFRSQSMPPVLHSSFLKCRYNGLLQGSYEVLYMWTKKYNAYMSYYFLLSSPTESWFWESCQCLWLFLHLSTWLLLPQLNVHSQVSIFLNIEKTIKPFVPIVQQTIIKPFMTMVMKMKQKEHLKFHMEP